MIHDKEFEALLQSVAEKSLKIINELQQEPARLQLVLSQFIDLTEQFQNLLMIILQNQEKIWQMQWQYWQDTLLLVQQQCNFWLEGKPMPINDPRFNHDEWLTNPFFNWLSQNYLLAVRHVNSLLETMDSNDKTAAKKARFFAQQYLDALSPANFAATNPGIMMETMQSSGKNLLQGLHNLLTDLEKDSSRLRIRRTAVHTFTVGETIAATPGHVIFRNDLMELIQYSPQTPKVKSVPLLIIPPWINKYYILDLSAHNSLVNWLVQQGISVFIISWVNPDERYAKKTLAHYVEEGAATAVEIVQKQLSVSQVNTLGFCIGGTLQTLLLAYYAARKNTAIRSATFLATLIDFSDPGDLAVYIDEQQISKLEKEMGEKGYLPGESMASSFNSLKANELIWSFFVKNYLRGQHPVPFDILFWNEDVTNMPAAMHSEYLRWMYLNNDLIKPGKIRLNRTPIDISRITIPTFFLSTQKDHIALWKSTYEGFKRMNGPKRFVLGGSGHVAGIINAPQAKKYNYHVNHHAPADPQEWLDNAVTQAGSWWPEWLKWLKSHSGRLVTAPDADNLLYKPMMAAPGSYVHLKA